MAAMSEASDRSLADLETERQRLKAWMHRLASGAGSLMVNAARDRCSASVDDALAVGGSVPEGSRSSMPGIIGWFSQRAVVSCHQCTRVTPGLEGCCGFPKFPTVDHRNSPRAEGTVSPGEPTSVSGSSPPLWGSGTAGGRRRRGALRLGRGGCASDSCPRRCSTRRFGVGADRASRLRPSDRR